MSFQDTEVFSTEDTEVARLSTQKDIVVMTQEKGFNFFGQYIKQRHLVMVQIDGKTEYFEAETFGGANIYFRHYAKEILKRDHMLSDLLK